MTGDQPPSSCISLRSSRSGSGSFSNRGGVALGVGSPVLVKALDFARNSARASMPWVVPSSSESARLREAFVRR